MENFRLEEKTPFRKKGEKIGYKYSINFRYEKQFRRINTFRSNYLSVKIQKKLYKRICRTGTILFSYDLPFFFFFSKSSEN